MANFYKAVIQDGAKTRQKIPSKNQSAEFSVKPTRKIPSIPECDSDT